MKKQLKWILAVVGLAVFIVGAYFLYNTLSLQYSPDRLGDIGNGADFVSSGQSGQTASKQRYEAPDFTVIDGEGNDIKLSDLKGKPVVLNFWASWCYPCQSEMADFNDVYNEVGDKVQFMMVNLTDGAQETLSSAKEYVASKGYSFPIYYDTEMEAAMAYNVMSVPVTYFIDSQGYLVRYAAGVLDEEHLRSGVDKLLKE